MSGIESYTGQYAHGTRARYVSAKCRCVECTTANREYAKAREAAKRAGDGDPLVDAGAARAHLLALSEAGVGKRAVQAASDVALSVLQDVRTGAKTRIRAHTERRILAVDASAISDHALVSARATKVALHALQGAGLTKSEIAARLGSSAKTPALQLGQRRVLAATALKVRRLLSAVRDERVCGACDLSHGLEPRLAQLRTFAVDELADLPRTWPCLYGGASGLVRLREDLGRIGVVVPGLAAGPDFVREDGSRGAA